MLLSRLARRARAVPCRRLSAPPPLPPNKPLTRTAKVEAAGSELRQADPIGNLLFGGKHLSIPFLLAALAGMVYLNSGREERLAAEARVERAAQDERRAAIHEAREAREARARARRTPRDRVTPNARTLSPRRRRAARRPRTRRRGSRASGSSSRTGASSGPTSAAAVAARASAWRGSSTRFPNSKRRSRARGASF